MIGPKNVNRQKVEVDIERLKLDPAKIMAQEDAVVDSKLLLDYSESKGGWGVWEVRTLTLSVVPVSGPSPASAGEGNPGGFKEKTEAARDLKHEVVQGRSGESRGDPGQTWINQCKTGGSLELN